MIGIGSYQYRVSVVYFAFHGNRCVTNQKNEYYRSVFANRYAPPSGRASVAAPRVACASRLTRRSSRPRPVHPG